MTDRQLYAEMGRISDALRDFYSSADLIEWWTSPHPQLDGRTATDVLESGEGARLWAIADQLRSGAYL